MSENKANTPEKFRILKAGQGCVRNTPLHPDEESEYRQGVTWAKWTTGNAVVSRDNKWLALTGDVTESQALTIARQWRKGATVEEWTADGKRVAWVALPAKRGGN